MQILNAESPDPPKSAYKHKKLDHFSRNFNKKTAIDPKLGQKQMADIYNELEEETEMMNQSRKSQEDDQQSEYDENQIH